MPNSPRIVLEADDYNDALLKAIEYMKKHEQKTKTHTIITKGTDKAFFKTGNFKGPVLAKIIELVLIYLNKTINEMDKIGKSAKEIGVSAEEFQGLVYAAKSVYFDMNELKTLFYEINQLAQDAFFKNEDAIKKLYAIGLEAKDLKGKQPYQQFETIAQAINLISDPIERISAGTDIFGKKFNKISCFLENYKSNIQEFKDKGLMFSNEVIKSAEDFNESSENINRRLKTIVMNPSAVNYISTLTQKADYLFKNIHPICNSTFSLGAPNGTISRQKAVVESVQVAKSRGKLSPLELSLMEKYMSAYGDGKDSNATNEKAYKLLDHAMKINGFRKGARSYTLEQTPTHQFQGIEYITRGNTLERNYAEINSREKANSEYAARHKAAKKKLEKQKELLITLIKKHPISIKEEEFYEWEMKIKTSRTIRDLQKIATQMDLVWKKAEYLEKIDFDKKRSTLFKKINTIPDIGEKNKRRKEIQYATSKKQLDRISADIDKKEQKQKIIDAYERESYIRELIIAGKEKEARIQKEINTLKETGLFTDEEARFMAEEKIEQLEKIKEMKEKKILQRQTSNGNPSLYAPASFQKDNIKKENFNKVLNKAQNEKEYEPTDDEKALVEQRTNLFSRKNTMRGQDLSDMEIRTNELTSRGGFIGVAAASDKNSINKTVDSHLKASNRNLTEIKQILEDIVEG